MTHIDPDVLLEHALTPEAPAPSDVADHLATCPACRDELASLKQVISMTRESADLPLVAPPEHLWSAIAAELDGDATPDATSPASVTRIGSRHAGPRARTGWWLAAAAAAGIAIGSAATALVTQQREEPSPSTVVVATAPLDTLDTQRRLGTASLVRTDGQVDLTVAAASLTPASDGYLEVWLINKDLSRMVSVGVMRPGASTQTFTVSQQLIDQGYVIVDISREAFDDKPTHSGESLVRGSLAV